MFKASIQLEVLAEILNSAESIVKECRLKFTKEGIDLIASDSAHVGIIQVKFQSKIYKDFDGEDTEIAFPIKKFKEVIALGKSEQVATLEFNETENRLVISFGDTIRRMALLDKNSVDSFEMPKLTYDSSFVMKTEDLRNGIRGSASVADHIVFQFTAKGLKLETTSELDTIETFIPRSRIIKSSEMSVDDKYVSMYPLELLADMVKAISSADQVAVMMGNDYPLRLDYGLSGGAGRAIVIIAPRTEDAETT